MACLLTLCRYPDSATVLRSVLVLGLRGWLGQQPVPYNSKLINSMSSAPGWVIYCRRRYRSTTASTVPREKNDLRARTACRTVLKIKIRDQDEDQDQDSRKTSADAGSSFNVQRSPMALDFDKTRKATILSRPPGSPGGCWVLQAALPSSFPPVAPAHPYLTNAPTSTSEGRCTGRSSPLHTGPAYPVEEQRRQALDWLTMLVGHVWHTLLPYRTLAFHCVPFTPLGLTIREVLRWIRAADRVLEGHIHIVDLSSIYRQFRGPSDRLDIDDI